MRTIAFYSPKGGVGKTASSVNIAYLASQAGNPTVLWDLDPQGAGSWYLGVDKPRRKVIANVVQGKSPIGSALHDSNYAKLSVIPADSSCRDLDIILDGETAKRKILKQTIAPLGDDYSLTILDCPPTFSTTAKNVFSAVDALFVPLIPTHLSLNAYEELMLLLSQKKYADLKIYPFFTMVDRRRALHKEILESPPKFLKNLLKASIPYASQIEKMGDHQAPVNAFANASIGGLAYRVLWYEIVRKIKGVKKDPRKTS